MCKIGGISLTQTPTTDIRADMLAILGEGVELLEAGALDGMSMTEIAALAPADGERALTDRLLDGTRVVVREQEIIGRMQGCIDALQAQGAKVIAFYCGGDFTGLFHADVPLVFPLQLMNGIVPSLSLASRIAVMTPLPSQVEEAKRKWEGFVKCAIPVVGNPHDGMTVVRQSAEITRDLDVDLAVLDCFGFSMEMKAEFMRISGKRAVSSRTLLARVLCEFISA